MVEEMEKCSSGLSVSWKGVSLFKNVISSTINYQSQAYFTIIFITLLTELLSGGCYLIIRQCKSHIRVAGSSAEFTATTSQHNILLAVQFISSWCGKVGIR